MRRQRYSQLANKLKPYMNQSAVVILNTGATGEAPGDHVHDFTGLEGELLPEQAPWVTTALNALKPHGITDPIYHSVTGSQYSVVGLVADHTIGLLPSTNDAATYPNTLLRGGAAGAVTLGALTVRDGVNPQIAITTDEGRLFPNTRLQTDNFSSQLAGWRMTYAGELDARYIFANEMKIIKFIADMQQALAGSQIISKSVTTLAATFTAPRPGGNAGLIVDDLPSAEGMPVFEDGDTVLVTEDSRESGGFSSVRCWGTVSGYVDLPDKKQDWTFTRYGDFGLSVPTWTGAPRLANGSSTILSVTKVDATVSGNQMIACVLVESTSVTTTAPAGWTQISTATVTGMSATLYSKVAGASEPASYAWTHSSAVDSMVILENFSLQDPTTPISGWAVNVHETATAAPVIKSVTPVSDTDFYVGFVAARANRHPVIQPSGWVSDVTFTAGGNTLAAMHSLTDGYAGIPFGDVSAALTGGTARCITFTVNIIPQPIVLDLETGYMPIDNTVAPGAFILDYGVSGNGWHEITAIDGIYGSNSPYSRVVSWTGHPATGAIVRTQSGNLNGIFGEGAEWGFFAGNGVSPTVSQFLRLSDRGARLNNLALSLYSAGEQRVNISADGQDVWIGTFADRRLSWNGLVMAIKGAVTIDQASGFAGSGYLQIGAGVKDSDLNGFHLSATEIVGQAAGIDQVTMGTDGLLKAAAGAAWIDRNGFNVAANLFGNPEAFRFMNGTTLAGAIGFVRSSGMIPLPDDGMVFLNDDSTKFRFVGATLAEFNQGVTSTNYFDAPAVYANNIFATTQAGDPWVNLSFGTGWTNYGGSYQTARYKKFGDLIFLKGLVARTSGAGTLIGTLPTGFRPAAQSLFGSATNTGLGRVDITTSGQISLMSGGADWVQLDGLVFSTL